MKCAVVQTFAENTANPGLLRCTLDAGHLGKHRTAGGVSFGPQVVMGHCGCHVAIVESGAL